MALIVTPGAENANGYVSLADFKTYCDDRGLTYPTTSGADDTITAAIIRGASYTDGRYRGRWKGLKADEDQALAWPRVNVRDEDGYILDDDTIPRVVAHANAEAALRFIDGVDLTPDLERGGAVKRTRDKAGPVETESEFRDDASARTAVTAIDDLLSGVLRGGNVGWLERA